MLSEFITKTLNEYPNTLTPYCHSNETTPILLASLPIYVIHCASPRQTVPPPDTMNAMRRRYITHVMKWMNLNYILCEFEPISQTTYSTITHLNMCKGIPLPITIGEVGCCLSHLWCMRHAIAAENTRTSPRLTPPYFLILEDDVIFAHDFATKCGQYLQQVYSSTPTLDMCMLGAADQNIRDNLKTYDNDKEWYTCVKPPLGGHANIYSLEYARRFLEYNTQVKFHSLDFHYFRPYRPQTPTIVVCMPNVVVCELSTTNLRHQYSFLSPEKEHAYYTQFFAGCEFHFDMYHFMYIDVLIRLQRIYQARKNKPFRSWSHIWKYLENEYTPETLAVLAERLDGQWFSIDRMNNILDFA